MLRKKRTVIVCIVFVVCWAFRARCSTSGVDGAPSCTMSRARSRPSTQQVPAVIKGQLDGERLTSVWQARAFPEVQEYVDVPTFPGNKAHSCVKPVSHTCTRRTEYFLVLGNFLFHENRCTLGADWTLGCAFGFSSYRDHLFGQNFSIKSRGTRVF